MVTIRAADIKDVPTIHELAHRIWPDAYKDILSPEQLAYMLDMMYSYEALQYQIEKQKHEFFIALEDEQAVGFASISPKFKISESIYRLNKIYVLPEMQHKGIGQKLMAHIISLIKPRGAAILELNVNRNNKAMNFYERLGFKITKEEDLSIGNGYYMNDYVMQKELVDAGY
jgi:diamine N-acetyltransferase